MRERSSEVVSARGCTEALKRRRRRWDGLIGAAGSDEKVDARGTCGRSGPARCSRAEEPSGPSAARRGARRGGCSDRGEWPVLGAVLVFVALAVVLLGLFGDGGALHSAGRAEVVSVR